MKIDFAEQQVAQTGPHGLAGVFILEIGNSSGIENVLIWDSSGSKPVLEVDLSRSFAIEPNVLILGYGHRGKNEVRK